MKRKKVMTIYVREDDSLEYDLGKKPRQLFSIIAILAICMKDLCHLGYKSEEEIYEKKINKTRKRIS